MKTLRILSVLIVISVLPSGFSCDPCFEVRCTQNIPFRLIDASSKRNLILGPYALYNYDSISFRYASARSLLNGSNEFPATKAILSDMDLMIETYELVDTLLLRLWYKDYDTLFISFRMGSNDCCANGLYELNGI